MTSTPLSGQQPFNPANTGGKDEEEEEEEVEEGGTEMMMQKALVDRRNRVRPGSM